MNSGKDTQKLIQDQWNLNALTRFTELSNREDATYYGITLPLVSYLANQSKKLLDVGCGMGFLSNFLAISGRAVVGIDFTKLHIDIAKKEFPNINFICGNILTSTFNTLFDTVTAIMFFHNVPDPLPILRKISSLLEDRGRLIIIVPNSEVWFQKRKNATNIKSLTTLSGEKAYLLPFKIKGHENHPSLFTYFDRDKDCYISLLNAAGFSKINHVTEAPNIEIPDDYLVLVAEK